jgi:hypothetical protein
LNKKFIEPNNLRDFWFYVRPKLEIILSRSPERWIPEDIYADCLSGRSMLWLGFYEEKPFGFVVVQCQEIDTLHLWAGYCEQNIPDAVKWKLIEEVAKDLKMKKISFESWRKGWIKKSKQLGFVPRKYIKELS